jgi:cation diffusion facilitator CzcD-associated flavoprotein CzcO
MLQPDATSANPVAAFALPLGSHPRAPIIASDGEITARSPPVPHATSQSIHSLFEGWMGDLESALRDDDKTALAELFLADSYWRDLAALTWDVRQYWGRDKVVPRLLEYAKVAKPTGFHVASNRTAPRVLDDLATADFFFTFDTATGSGSALVIAVLDDQARWGLRARLIATTLTGLKDHPIAPRTRRGYALIGPGETWVQYRARVNDLSDRDPDVLVLGGGQSGVIMGARLDRLGVSYLVVDKHARPGDGWRGRYSSLALHTPTCVNDMPYVRQPETFPGFLSKDQWGNYVDAYADMMHINYWGKTEFVTGTFDEEARQWTVKLRVSDGSMRTMHPKQIVTALGYTGTEPSIPDLPGIADFGGQVIHSSKFSTGADYRGQRVMVIGSATSGHDISLDLADHDAAVFMGQRGPACVVPIDEAENFNLDYLNPAFTVEEIDQRRNSAFVYPLLLRRAQAETERTEREYAEMFDGLRKAGMTLTIGDEKAGWIHRLHKTFSGYYLDVGASQAIVDGRIKIIQMANVDRFVSRGVRLNDGNVIELDTVVMATGYRNVQTTIARLFGEEVADRVGPIGGIADDGEHRNMARPTRQPHLWMLFGGIMDARKMSEVLALQIVAQLDGTVGSLVRADDGGVRVLDDTASATGTPS